MDSVGTARGAQQQQQQGSASRASVAVGVLYLHFLHNNDFANLLNSWTSHLWVKPQRERIKWNKREIKIDLSAWFD